jgi:hypothetical protein
MYTIVKLSKYFLWFAISLQTALLHADVTLYTTDTRGDNLISLSLMNGSGTVVGPFGSSDVMAGLGYDSTQGILYGSDALSGNLHSINQSTGAAALIGSLGLQRMQGLGFSNQTGTLYGTAYPGDGDLMTSIYRINTTTGFATSIGSTGFDAVSGLAIHPLTDVIYGVVGGPLATGSLITIDATTGAGTLVADDFQRLVGLAFHPFTNVLYGVDNGINAATPGSLYTIDLDTRVATLVGQTGIGNNLGLEFAGYSSVPEPNHFLLMLSSLLMVTMNRRRAILRSPV